MRLLIYICTREDVMFIVLFGFTLSGTMVSTYRPIVRATMWTCELTPRSSLYTTVP